MTNKMLIFALILSFCITINVTVQLGVTSVKSPYIREGSIGKEEVKSEISKNNIFPIRKISEWTGERFVFMPHSKSVQEIPFMNEYNSTWWEKRLLYNKYVGRIAKVISVTEYEEGVKFNRGYDKGWQVEFEMEDDKSKLIAKGSFAKADDSDCITDITSIADIDNARSRWLGKTLWHKSKSIQTYNEKTGECSSIEIKQYCPVKVIDIVVGWDHEKPIRFILQTPSGEVGYEDIHFAGCDPTDKMYVNILWFYVVSSHPNTDYIFNNFFLEKNPRIKYKWSNRVWSAIENAKVFVGMTQEQAAMSWSYPSDTNKTITGNSTYSQWVYKSGSYLYFENGILTSIQK